MRLSNIVLNGLVLCSLTPFPLWAINNNSLCDPNFNHGNNIYPPNSYFALSSWKLTLPISKSNCFTLNSNEDKADNAAEIYPSSQSQKNLNTTVKPLNNDFLFFKNDKSPHNDYFFLKNNDKNNNQKAMVFRTPLTNFATTGSSSNPRTELRELYSGSNAFKDSWPFGGKHVLKGSFQVTAFESSDERTQKTVFAQIHGLDPDTTDTIKINPLIKFVWRKVSNNLSGEVYALVKDQPIDTVNDNDLKIPFGTFPPYQVLDYEIRLEGQTLTLMVNGQQKVITVGKTLTQSDGTSWTFHNDWINQHLYFKAGNYAQLHKPKENDPPLQQANSDYIEVRYSSLAIDPPAPAITPIVNLLLADGNLQENISPYTLSKFQSVIQQSRLQMRKPGTANQDIRLNQDPTFSSEGFYLESNRYMTFHASGSGNDIRSELRQDSLWSTANSAGKKMIASLKLSIPNTPGLNEYTWMQIHDKPPTNNDPANKPLVRLVWLRAKNGETNHRIGAIVKQDATGDNKLDKHIDLGIMPRELFKAELKVQNNILKIKINNEEVDNGVINVGFWADYLNYFKAGVYLQGNGAATVQFDSLKYYDSY